jgi:hypothetical protein
MMGYRQVEQAALFYELSLDKHIPADHLLRWIDRFVEFGDVRRELTPFYRARWVLISAQPSSPQIPSLSRIACKRLRTRRQACLRNSISQQTPLGTLIVSGMSHFRSLCLSSIHLGWVSTKLL